jgi:hypothetical protein
VSWTCEFSSFTEFIDENEMDFEEVEDIVMMHHRKLQSGLLTKLIRFPENQLDWM